MFSIDSISLPAGKSATLTELQPTEQVLPLLHTVLGPQGAEYEVSVEGLGDIILRDLGDTVDGGPGEWAVRINNDVNWFYNGAGRLNIVVNENGHVTVNGGNASVRTVMAIGLDPDVLAACELSGKRSTTPGIGVGVPLAFPFKPGSR